MAERPLDSPSRSNRLKSAPSHLAGDYECSETTGSNDTSPSEPKPKRARPDTSGDLALARRLAREGARPRKPVTPFATLVDNGRSYIDEDDGEDEGDDEDEGDCDGKGRMRMR